MARQTSPPLGRLLSGRQEEEEAQAQAHAAKLAGKLVQMLLVSDLATTGAPHTLLRDPGRCRVPHHGGGPCHACFSHLSALSLPLNLGTSQQHAACQHQHRTGTSICSTSRHSAPPSDQHSPVADVNTTQGTWGPAAAAWRFSTTHYTHFSGHVAEYATSSWTQCSTGQGQGPGPGPPRPTSQQPLPLLSRIADEGLTWLKRHLLERFDD